MASEWNFCSTPAGYSERDYDGYDGSGSTQLDFPHGYHDLATDSCWIKFGWVRASNGEPTYARIDFTRSAISDPLLGFDIRWQRMTSGDFSWGTATIGIGDAGSGDDPITYPLIGVQITGETDVAGGRRYRGVFQNAAGTIFSTNWVPIDTINTFQGLTGIYTFTAWIDGSTGWITAEEPASTGHSETRSVALSGSFLGNYDRWESYHLGGGGGSSNAGDFDPTGVDKASFGEIRSVRVTDDAVGWRIGGIGRTW